jgi:hypothetical protein
MKVIHETPTKRLMIDIKHPRLRRAFIETWRSLSRKARRQVWRGIGSHQVLAVSDEMLGRRPTWGGLALSFHGDIAGVRLAPPDARDSSAYLRWVCAHELAHHACGHIQSCAGDEWPFRLSADDVAGEVWHYLTTRRNIEPVIGPIVPRRRETYLRHEREADAWADRQGFRKPEARDRSLELDTGAKAKIDYENYSFS